MEPVSETLSPGTDDRRPPTRRIRPFPRYQDGDTGVGPRRLWRKGSSNPTAETGQTKNYNWVRVDRYGGPREVTTGVGDLWTPKQRKGTVTTDRPTCGGRDRPYVTGSRPEVPPVRSAHDPRV